MRLRIIHCIALFLSFIPSVIGQTSSISTIFGGAGGRSASTKFQSFSTFGQFAIGNAQSTDSIDNMLGFWASTAIKQGTIEDGVLNVGTGSDGELPIASRRTFLRESIASGSSEIRIDSANIFDEGDEILIITMQSDTDIERVGIYAGPFDSYS